MEYRLIGLLAFRDIGACFLIPCFGLGNSSEAFAQEVDERGFIAAFHPIEAARYHGEEQTPLGIARAPGQAAFFAVRLQDGEILHGTYEALSAQLSEIDLVRRGAAFFNIDALAFIGDLTKRDQAVEVAGSLIGDERLSQEWRRIARYGRRVGLSRQMVREGATRRGAARRMGELEAWFRQSLDDASWADRWKAEWPSARERAWLREVALVWLATNGDHTRACEIIFSLVMEQSPSNSAAAFAINWLEGRQSTPLWAEIWLSVERLRRPNGPMLELKRLGLQFLDRSIAKGEANLYASLWAKVWSRLHKGPAERDRLYDLVLNFLDLFGGNRVFQQRVLARFARAADAPFLLDERLVAWMRHGEVSSVWVDLFDAIGPNRLPKDLVKRAVDYLRKCDEGAATWGRLWLSVMQLEQLPLARDGELDELAFKWLEGAAWSFRSWPRVLLLMMKRYPNHMDLESQAMVWVNDYSDNPLSDEIGGLIFA